MDEIMYRFEPKKKILISIVIFPDMVQHPFISQIVFACPKD